MITPPNPLRQIAQCNLFDIADSLRHRHCIACIDYARASCNITVPDPDLEIRRGAVSQKIF